MLIQGGTCYAVPLLLTSVPDTELLRTILFLLTFQGNIQTAFKRSFGTITTEDISSTF